MEVLKPGKSYALVTAHGERAVTISFCEKVDGKFIDGLTNEELINMMIDRYEYLVSISQSVENMNSLLHLKQAKSFMHSRNYKKLESRKNESTRTTI